ncbi:multidrug effflux MFS transporter [Lentilactobacillus senioris]|uniref:multidrug effflux MFS transporter n=1 Tax=Lentilactobacillus senioris TaxID=931534 RepID=UPI002282BC17|nr:multidrug effflux MFS transporter [Lentilactobacillus senioris]MCY9806590.1 multidrug effflux MFS transporter [Lentilactobacillus senioris]
MKNVHKKIPSVILIIALVGFPQISESIFTPVLPAISQAMQVSAQTSQLTMSSYFIGFAIGVLFWGWLSDRVGRRPAMSWGIVVYLLGNIGLLLASNFAGLMVARVVQAFGAATGSVVTQTIMRESFAGIKGKKVFAQVSAAMALSPALGPLLGGEVQSYFGNYRSVFAVLISMAVILYLVVLLKLPETRVPTTSEVISPWYRVAMKMLKSPQVWGYCLIISGINGILFSYYAEAPFVFERHFGLSVQQYGWLGIVMAAASITGAVTANWLAGKVRAEQITNLGLLIALIGSLGMLIMATYLPLLLLTVFITFMGVNVTLPIALNQALIGFEDVIGTASGLLSFVYYLIISALTFLMSVMHDGTVWALPKYMVLVIVMMVFGRLITGELSKKGNLIKE